LTVAPNDAVVRVPDCEETMTEKPTPDPTPVHDTERLKPDTRLVVGGRDPHSSHGFVNPPVYHASTVLYRTAEDLIAHRGRYTYGRRGTPSAALPRWRRRRTMRRRPTLKKRAANSGE
jgi:hypothetical protein